MRAEVLVSFGVRTKRIVIERALESAMTQTAITDSYHAMSCCVATASRPAQAGVSSPKLLVVDDGRDGDVDPQVVSALTVTQKARMRFLALAFGGGWVLGN